MANNAESGQAVESRVTELLQENKLLLSQLHHAQEELERNYSHDRKVEMNQPGRSQHSDANINGWVADELPEVHAENRRLKELVDVQRNVYKLESDRALNVRLGNMLIEGADSPGALLTLPGKLMKIWRQTSRQIPPAVLGGKDFSKIIAVYESGGFDAVEQSADQNSVSPAMKANAYTALARKLGKGDRANAAEAARRAYSLDPKAFRLKWLAFRLHEAGDVIEAEAMLDILPADTPFSESEVRQARQLRAEAVSARHSEAKQKTSFAARKSAAELQLTRLAQERDQQTKLAAEHARQIEVLKGVQAKLEQEKSALAMERARIERQLRETKLALTQKKGEDHLLLRNLHLVQEELEQLFGERESLQLANAQLEEQIETQASAQAVQLRDAEGLGQEIELLKQDQAQRQMETAALVAERDRIEKQLWDVEAASTQKSGENQLLLTNLHESQEVLKQLLGERERQQLANAQLEQAIQALTGAQAAQTRDADERAREIDTLKQAIARLEHDKEALVRKHEAQCQTAEQFGQELETLKQRNALLDQEKQALQAKYEAQRQAAERFGQELQTLNRRNASLDQEKQALQAKYEAQCQTAEQFGQEFEALKQRNALLDQEKQALQAKYEAQRQAAERFGQELQTLSRRNASLDQEKQALQAKYEAQCQTAERFGQELETLKQRSALLDQEKQALRAKFEVEIRIVEERDRELDALRQTKAHLEEEKQSLVVKHEVQSTLVAERDRELEALKQAKAALERERQALVKGLEAQTRVVEERGRQLEALTQVKVRLEQEKQTLVEGRDAQTRVAQECTRELDTLKLAAKKLEQEKAAALAKLKPQAGGIGSGNRGDADIADLIGDLELFFNGKSIIYVDVGAYVGDVFLKINSSIKNFRIHEAHLFEPNPASYAELAGKISGMEKPIVHAYNMAVGESTDVHRFIPAKSMTKALPANLPQENVPHDVFAAGSVSLDSQSSIFTDGKINLLKVDVEGKELDVLTSARALLTSQSVDILYIEVGFNRAGNQQTYFAEIDQFLQGFGYRVMRVYEQKEEWMKGSPLLRRANIAYMSESFANAHPLKLMKELRELRERVKELSSTPVKSEV